VNSLLKDEENLLEGKRKREREIERKIEIKRERLR